MGGTYRDSAGGQDWKHVTWKSFKKKWNEEKYNLKESDIDGVNYDKSRSDVWSWIEKRF